MKSPIKSTNFLTVFLWLKFKEIMRVLGLFVAIILIACFLYGFCFLINHFKEYIALFLFLDYLFIGVSLAVGGIILALMIYYGISFWIKSNIKNAREIVRQNKEEQEKIND